MARPTKATDDKRGHIVSFRVNPEEHAVLSAKAAASGVIVSDFARAAALHKPVKPRHSAVPVDAAIFALVKELRPVGVNLNQLTREMHIGARDNSDRLARNLAMLELILAELYQRMGIGD